MRDTVLLCCLYCAYGSWHLHLHTLPCGIPAFLTLFAFASQKQGRTNYVVRTCLLPTWRGRQNWKTGKGRRWFCVCGAACFALPVTSVILSALCLCVFIHLLPCSSLLSSFYMPLCLSVPACLLCCPLPTPCYIFFLYTLCNGNMCSSWSLQFACVPACLTGQKSRRRANGVAFAYTQACCDGQDRTGRQTGQAGQEEQERCYLPPPATLPPRTASCLRTPACATAFYTTTTAPQHTIHPSALPVHTHASHHPPFPTTTLLYTLFHRAHTHTFALCHTTPPPHHTPHLCPACHTTCIFGRKAGTGQARRWATEKVVMVGHCLLPHRRVQVLCSSFLPLSLSLSHPHPSIPILSTGGAGR